ncbi:MAG: hypothetical protein HZB77_14415 [Chloroflexi bacterium]|nr:hypothetical protein [Chloroflexota bacterium]
MEQVSALISSFFTDAGPGGVVVLSVIVLASFIYFVLMRWILQADEDELSVPPKAGRYYRGRSFNK